MILPGLPDSSTPSVSSSSNGQYPKLYTIQARRAMESGSGDRILPESCDERLRCAREECHIRSDEHEVGTDVAVVLRHRGVERVDADGFSGTACGSDRR